jgi:hypothetical protein
MCCRKQAQVLIAHRACCNFTLAMVFYSPGSLYHGAELQQATV